MYWRAQKQVTIYTRMLTFVIPILCYLTGKLAESSASEKCSESGKHARERKVQNKKHFLYNTDGNGARC